MTEVAAKKKRKKYEPAEGTVLQAYVFALDLTPAQGAAARSHVGGARFAYNFLLRQIEAANDQRKAEESYGITGEGLTPRVNVSHYSLRKLWNESKTEVAPWWDANSKEAYSSAAKNLSVAMSNFFDSLSGKRKGPKMDFPTAKKKNARQSVTFTTGAIRLEADRRHITLPRLGTLKTHESTRQLARRVERGTAKILSATLSYYRGKWQVSFRVEVQRAIPATRTPDRVIGIDWGLKTLYTGATPDGEIALRVENPRNTAKAAAALRHANRIASRRQGPQPGIAPSNRWRKAQARANKIHHSIATRRIDNIHKTTTYLAKNFDVICIEDLYIPGMLKNRRLAKAVQDASFGEFRRQLEYKTTWYGSKLITAPRFYPSSKTCSGCNTAKTKLLLSEREFVCTNCGLIIDRDENASINLARFGKSNPAGSISVAGRGGKQKTRKAARRPSKAAAREASTSQLPPAA